MNDENNMNEAGKWKRKKGKVGNAEIVKTKEEERGGKRGEECKQ